MQERTLATTSRRRLAAIRTGSGGAYPARASAIWPAVAMTPMRICGIGEGFRSPRSGSPDMERSG